MVKLNKIYTKTGDKGTTGLGTGDRIPKDDERIAAYGTVDELNAVIGLVKLHLDADQSAVDAMLSRIQHDLFDLGADLCMPDRGEKLEYEPLRIVPKQVDRLEAEIDELNGELEPLKSFILPGGTAAAAYLHLARTVCRRAERLMVTLADKPDETVSDSAMMYINRLSDLLFVVGRFVNDKGQKDILWSPGATR